MDSDLPNDATAPEVVRIDRMATGGAGVGRRPNGQVVFVAGAVPDETVAVSVFESKKRFARARLIEVIEPGASRRRPSCGHAEAGECGGCDWLHVAPEAQRAFKTAIVADQLLRLGGIAAPLVDHAESGGGPRTTVRCVVADGRAGYRAPASHDAFAAASCQAAHGLIEPLIVGANFGRCDEVTLRASHTTEARLAILHGEHADPGRASLPADVTVVTGEAPGDASIEETVGDRTFRISARSFFQASPQGADALASAVAEHLAALDAQGSVVDLYGGVGLLGSLAAPERLAALVEWSDAAVADASHNLGDLDVSVERARVERWTPQRRFDTAIADPARRGLGREGVGAVTRTGASTLVLVNCDPAAAGRDTGLLAEQGWSHVRSTVVDLFPDTSSIEAVSSFRRSVALRP